MYIQYCAYQPGVQYLYSQSLRNTYRNYDIDELKSYSFDAARAYSRLQYGGSFGSFLNKIKDIGKRIINSAITTTTNMYKPVKWITEKIAKNDTVKGIVSKLGDAVGTSVGVPGLGKIITTGITAADNITDGIENVIKGIKEKNPQVSVQEAKNLVNTVKNSVDSVVNSTNISDEEKNKILDRTNQIYNKLPDVIKASGYNKVKQAAGYLPFIDPSTLSETERTGKGGRILKPKIRVLKPRIINDLFKDGALKLNEKYNPEVVAEITNGIYGGTIKRHDWMHYPTRPKTDEEKKREKLPLNHALMNPLPKNELTPERREQIIRSLKLDSMAHAKPAKPAKSESGRVHMGGSKSNLEKLKARLNK